MAALVITSIAGCGGGGGEAQGALADEALGVREVEVAEVEPRDFSRSFRASGSLEPRDQARIRALADGQLMDIAVDIGDPVEEGQTLFRTRETDANLRLRRAEAGLQRARADLLDLRAWRRAEELEQLRAQVDEARAEYERLDDERERTRVLFERNSVSQSEWDSARAAAERARAALRSAEADLQIAERGPTDEQLAIAEAAVAEAEAAAAEADQEVRDTTIEAPYSGVITGRFFKRGDFVRRGDEVVELSAMPELEAEMRVPERFAGMIQPGMPVEVTVESTGQSRSGIVTAISPSIDQSTRTFLVKVAVDNSDLSIMAGAFGVGVFRLPELQDVLAIPEMAVHEEEGRSYVWIADGGQAERRFVNVGEGSNGYVQVREGLEPGQAVVVDGYGALAEGDSLESSMM